MGIFDRLFGKKEKPNDEKPDDELTDITYSSHASIIKESENPDDKMTVLGDQKSKKLVPLGSKEEQKSTKDNIEKLKKNNDIEGLFKALEYRESTTEDRKSPYYQMDLNFQYEAFKALAEIGDIGVLLRMMRNYKKVPGVVGTELPIFFGSHSNNAFSVILKKSDILPEEVVSILIESSQSDDELIRDYAYENLGKAYPKASETNKPKIHDVIKRALEIEHGDALKGAQRGHKMMSEYLDADTKKNERVPILIKNLHDPSLDNYDLGCRAEELINLLELESVAYLTEAMKSSDFKIVSNATWALSYPLMNMSKRYDQKAFHEALVPAINYLQSVIKTAELSTDAEVYNWRVALAVTTIGKIGDDSVVSTLKELLSKVEKKVQETGVVQKYVNTGVAAGYISNEDYIKRIQEALNNTKSNPQQHNEMKV